MNLHDYLPDVFYGVDNLSIEEQVLLMEDAKEMCTEWRVDELDCSKSFARQEIKMEWADAMDNFKNAKGFRCFTFIHRRGYPAWPHRLEVGFRISMGVYSPDIFIWIYVPEEMIGLLAGKWGIDRRQL